MPPAELLRALPSIARTRELMRALAVLDAILQPVLREPAFTIDATTFLLWREPGDAAWRCGPVQPPPGEPDADGAN